MEDKFYTPDLIEFHIDFEYEILMPIGGYRKTTFGKESPPNPELNEFGNDDLMKIAHAITRVKYLDESDLVDLGWVEHTKSTEFAVDKGFWRVRIVGEGEVELDYEDNVDWEASFTLWKCQIKNKSEMKKLMEMLNIKSPIQKTYITN